VTPTAAWRLATRARAAARATVGFASHVAAPARRAALREWPAQAVVAARERSALPTATYVPRDSLALTGSALQRAVVPGKLAVLPFQNARAADAARTVRATRRALNARPQRQSAKRACAMRVVPAGSSAALEVRAEAVECAAQMESASDAVPFRESSGLPPPTVRGFRRQKRAHPMAQIPEMLVASTLAHIVLMTPRQATQ
jgi:hypothetical protein